MTMTLETLLIEPPDPKQIAGPDDDPTAGLPTGRGLEISGDSTLALSLHPLYEALFVKLLVATLLLALIRAVPRLGRSYGNRRSPAEPCIRWARASP